MAVWHGERRRQETLSMVGGEVAAGWDSPLTYLGHSGAREPARLSASSLAGTVALPEAAPIDWQYCAESGCRTLTSRDINEFTNTRTDQGCSLNAYPCLNFWWCDTPIRCAQRRGRGRVVGSSVEVSVEDWARAWGVRCMSGGWYEMMETSM